MLEIVISVVLLCLAIVLAFFMHKSKGNPNSIFTKSLFRVKSVRIFPVVSLVYAFFAAVVLFFGLLVADRASSHKQYIPATITEVLMTYEKFNTGFDYPLLLTKGRERISEGHPKILVIGDSFVEGQGITNQNQIWWGIMSFELERRGYDCNVYAVGYPGASTNDEFRWLRDTALLEK